MAASSFKASEKLSRSVSRIRTLSRSGAGAVPCVSGAPVESACPATQARWFTLVVPSGFIASMVVFSLFQLLVSVRSGTGFIHSAAGYIAGRSVIDWVARGMKQPSIDRVST